MLKRMREKRSEKEQRLVALTIKTQAMAAQIASDARVVNPSVSMAEFKEGVEQELEAQMIANGIKAINENR